MALFLGVVIGLFNGFIVVRTGLHSFLVTLATQFLLYGAMLGFARYLTGQTTLIVTFSGAARILFAGDWDYLPAELWWWLGLTVLVAWMLSKTVFGNWIYATGGNLRTARMAGVKTARVKISCFVFTAVASVLVGIIETAQTSTVSVDQGQLYEFEVIIAAVVGGVLMTGGYGSAIGVLFGSLTYGIADLGIFYTGWNTDWFQAFLGGLLLVAVLSNSWLRRKMLSTR
jgi:simple sugar transport system permease protein